MVHTVTLIAKETVALGTTRFRFERPEGFLQEAGQTIDLTLIEPKETDAEGNMRTFSIVSAPYENCIEIATRMRDTAFKRTLRDMQEGTKVSIEGPLGSFLLHENAKRPAVFLAGGIGITPFHAMAKDAAHRSLPHKIFLFYSNRRPEDSTFLEEFQKLEVENQNFKLVATMTEMEKSAKNWNGERGYIDEAMVKKYIGLDSMPVFYLAGPASMVAAMRKLLNGMGVSNDDIRFEEFSGY